MTLIEIRVMLKLGRRKRGHFVTLIEIHVHEIRVISLFIRFRLTFLGVDVTK